MTVLITLTTAGTDSGPFNLYSNLDGYVSAFATGVSKAALLAGYSSASVPDNTTIIRVKSNGVCVNYIDITLINITTTTTTTTLFPIIPCDATATSGGEGVTEYTVTLDSVGGLIVFELNSYGVPDKLEIIHNGVKKATSGMTTPNEGPFDNLYGDPTVPTEAETLTVDQFIGLNKGSISTRQVTFTSETGSSILIDSAYQQLVWFNYTPSDYSISSTVVIRVTGPAGTAWELKRLCEPTTTTTTTLAPAPEDFTYYQAEYNPCIAEACSGSPTSLWFYNLVPSLIVDKYYHDSVGDRAYHIIDGPFTYAEYVTAGSPLAIETNAGFASIMYNTCTCPPIAPE